jgi:hypothetical protein
MTTKRERLNSFQRASRAAALTDLLHDHLREGTDPVDPDTICLAVEMLHELLDTPESWEMVRNPKEEAEASDELAARRATVGRAAS